MYRELIKWLRECASGECFNCSQKGNALCPDDLMKQSADAIERLDAIAQTYVETVHEIEDKRKWIPVTERLPEDKMKALVCAGFFSQMIEVSIYNGLWFSSWDEQTEIIGVSHWMPLPQPPESEE